MRFALVGRRDSPDRDWRARTFGSLRCLSQSERVKEINGTDDANPLVCLQPQEVEVVRDDEVRLAGDSAGKGKNCVT